MRDLERLIAALANRRRDYHMAVHPDGSTWVTDRGHIDRPRSWFPVTFVFDRAGNYQRFMGPWPKALWISRGTEILWPGHYSEDLP